MVFISLLKLYISIYNSEKRLRLFFYSNHKLNIEYFYEKFLFVESHQLKQPPLNRRTKCKVDSF